MNKCDLCGNFSYCESNCDGYNFKLSIIKVLVFKIKNKILRGKKNYEQQNH